MPPCLSLLCIHPLCLSNLVQVIFHSHERLNILCHIKSIFSMEHLAPPTQEWQVKCPLRTLISHPHLKHTSLPRNSVCTKINVFSTGYDVTVYSMSQVIHIILYNVMYVPLTVFLSSQNSQMQGSTQPYSINQQATTLPPHAQVKTRFCS